MGYTVKALDFEGPLDLLLHLIKEAKIEIFDINIADITDQYLDYINNSNLNLNIDSEYLIMAADLIEMKAKLLLPKNEEEEEDPKIELINRLTEYQKYKEISQNFKQLEEERKKIYSKKPTFLDGFKDSSIKISEDISLEMLVQAFIKFQEKKEFEKPLNTVVTKREYSVYKRSTEIMAKLRKRKKIEFEELFDIYTKDYVVVTFLSILELAKKQNIIIKQKYSTDKIVIMAKE